MNKYVQKEQDTLTYGLSSDEAEELKENEKNVTSKFSSGDLTSKNLAQIGRLLEVNESNFDQIKNKPWFKKAWMIVSGERGKLVEQNIANLGKVQVGVIKVLGKLLTDSAVIKNNVLDVFERLDTIETDSHQLKRFLLKFNKQNQERYESLRQKLRKTRTSVWSIILATGFLVGAVLSLTALGGWQATLSATVCGIAAAVLVVHAASPFLKSEPSAPIPTKGNVEDPSSSMQASENTDLKRTEAFLGLCSGPKEKEDVFQVDAKISQVKDHFTISPKEQRLLFSLQSYLVRKDIEQSEGAKAAKKVDWWEKWKESVERSLEDKLVDEDERLFKGLEEISHTNLSLPKLGSILLEVRHFRPYFPLSENDDEYSIDYDADMHVSNTHKVAKKVGLDVQSVEDAYGKFELALEKIPKSNTRSKDNTKDLDNTSNKENTSGKEVVYELELPWWLSFAVIGGHTLMITEVIGTASGLSGSATVISSLAFFGGGAIATDGSKITGRTTATIGGGAVLEASAGTKLTDLLSKDANLTLRELAKLEAISKAYLVKVSNPENAILSVISSISNTKDCLENKLDSQNRNQNLEAKKKRRILRPIC